MRGPADSALWAITIGYWALFGLCFDPRIPMPDGIGYYAYAQSLLIDGDLSLFNEFGGWKIDPLFTQPTPLGHLNNLFAFGAALLWLPFIAVLHGFLCIARAFSSFATDGYSALYTGAAAFSSAVYGYLALILCYRLARRYAKREPAAWATVAIALFSPLWHYVTIEGCMSHAASAFSNALFVYMLAPLLPLTEERVEAQPRRSWLLLGSVGGLLSMVRWQDAILPGCVGFGLALGAARFAWRRARSGSGSRSNHAGSALVYFSSGFIVGFLPQGIIWQMQMGQPLAIPQGGQFLQPLHPALGTVLFSSHHSLFGWTPVVLIAVFGGCWLLWKRDPSLARLSTATFLLQMYVNAIVVDPAAGASFGARRFIGLTPLFVIGLALVLERVPRVLAGVLVIACGVWTMALWLAFIQHWVDPVRYVSYAELAAAVRHGAELAMRDVTALKIRRWIGSPAPSWLALSIAALMTLTVACAMHVAFRLRGAARAVQAGTAGVIVAAMVAGVGGIALAANRSAPMPVGTLRIGPHVLLDFGWYANARYDGNPFWPRAHILGAFQLPAQLQWERVPFQLLPPTRDRNAAASSLTTCMLPVQRFSLPLSPRPTRALHFALCGLGAANSGVAVLNVRVETQAGQSVQQTLHSGQEIWDFFTVPRVEATIHNGVGSVTGYTLPLQGTTVPTKLELSTPVSSEAIWPCAAVFAVTQEFSTDGLVSDTGPYASVDLAPVANADYAQNAFWPAAVLNHYSDLEPGVLEVAGMPFLLLNRATTPHDASVLSGRAFGSRGIRLPLERSPSTQLSLLAAIFDGGAVPRHVADLVVEYEHGPPTRSAVWSPRDVASYAAMGAQPSDWHGSGAQRLSRVVVNLDAGRTPKYLWLIDRSLAAVDTPNSSLSVFAFTQALSEAHAHAATAE